jgi:hypothetical protein
LLVPSSDGAFRLYCLRCSVLVLRSAASAYAADQKSSSRGRCCGIKFLAAQGLCNRSSWTARHLPVQFRSPQTINRYVCDVTKHATNMPDTHVSLTVARPFQLPKLHVDRQSISSPLRLPGSHAKRSNVTISLSLRYLPKAEAYPETLHDRFQ